MLEKNTAKSQKILSIDWPNLFNFALDRPSPKHDLLYWHINMTFSEKILETHSYFKPENIFADVDLILEPVQIKKMGKLESRVAFFKYYQDYINQHYVIIASNDLWQIYLRKSSKSKNMKKINTTSDL